jgi:drug/metabolite transporter (DMT)-like permease
MGWKLYGDLAFYACTAVALLFALMYLVFAPWWKTPTGRNIMAVMGSMALALGYFAWAIAVKRVPPGFFPIRAILFTGIALAIGWRVWMLIKAQFLQRKRGL